MANPTLLLTLLTLPLLYATASGPQPPTNFVHTSCNSTQYPELCEQSLTSYATSFRQSHRRVATMALSVSLLHARSAASFVNLLSAGSTRPLYSRASGAMQDCMDNMGDGVDRLSRAVEQMGRMGRSTNPAFAYRLNNVQTWASAALTDANTCLDGVRKSKINAVVKAATEEKVEMVVKVVANALALVNMIQT